MKVSIISVIIPVYNAEPYICRCLDSLVAQTFRDFEVILVNDGSTDDSGEICDEYATRDNRFRVIHQKNGGVSVARQTGIDNAQGEYVIHVDPDDWVEPEMLSALYQKAQETEADMVVCDFWFGNDYSSQKFYPETAENFKKKLLFQQLHGSCCNKLVRRVCYSSHGIGFTPSHIRMYEDLLFNFRILKYDVKVSYLPQAFYHYNIDNASSICHQGSKKNIQSMMDVIAEFEAMNLLDESTNYGYGYKKNVLFDAWYFGYYSMLQTLYPEIHNLIIKDGSPYRLFNPKRSCLAIAMKGKPKLALWVYKVNMILIGLKNKLHT